MHKIEDIHMMVGDIRNGYPDRSIISSLISSFAHGFPDGYILKANIPGVETAEDLDHLIRWRLLGKRRGY